MAATAHDLSLPSQRSRVFWLALSAASMAWCAFVLALQLSLPSNEPRLYFLDVGQGDAALLITAQYQKIVIDGGPDQRAVEQLSKILPFWDRTLDALILSHTHSDHYQGFIPIASRFTVRNLYLGMTNEITPTLRNLVQSVTSKGGKVTLLHAGRDLQLGPGQILDVLSPLDTKPTLTKQYDDNSLVGMLITPQIRVLFTGDISQRAEETLVRRYSQSSLLSDALKVPHHGSNTSSSLSFLNAVQPKNAIISAGRDNQFGHPHAVILTRLQDKGINIYRTDLCGTIELKFLSNKLAGSSPAC